MTQSGAATPGQSGPGSDGNESVFRITQISCITPASLLDCFCYVYLSFIISILFKFWITKKIVKIDI